MIHYHLAPYGYTLCTADPCSKPKDDPALDRICTDESCEGICEAAVHNAQRRQHLPGSALYGEVT